MEIRPRTSKIFRVSDEDRQPESMTPPNDPYQTLRARPAINSFNTKPRISNVENRSSVTTPVNPSPSNVSK